jgi:hypothetical protein
MLQARSSGLQRQGEWGEQNADMQFGNLMLDVGPQFCRLVAVNTNTTMQPMLDKLKACFPVHKWGEGMW